MKADVEPLEGNKVKLSIEVDEQEFEKDIDAAFRKIAREVRIPGFRPGKAPRRILEARLGKETGRSEALRDALPGYYSRAVRQHEVDVVAAPQIDIKGGEESGPVTFDAVVEIRPQIHLAGYDGLRVTIPNPVPTDADIDEQVDRLRGNFAQLEPVERPARTGDHVTIDLQGTHDGEPVAGLTTDDFVYEVGSGSVLPEMDAQLDGAKVGDILAFDADVPGTGTTNFRLLVKEVKAKVLPELTDEWASESSEFDTVEELRADIAQRVRMVRKVQATMTLRNQALESLIGLVEDEPPESMIESEIERQVHDLGHRLEAQGATIQDYLDATGQSAESLVAAFRQQAVPAVKADLALRAVAEAEGIEPTDDDIDAEIARMAEAYGVKPAQLRRNLESAEQMPAVRSDWKKSRALEWLIEHVEIVDAEGQTIDRALLEPDSAAAGGEDGSETGSAPQGDEAPAAKQVDSSDDPESDPQDREPKDEETAGR